MIERTLVLIKPDAVQRAIVGDVITRFERTGLKIIGAKMVWIDEAFAKNHYREDMARKHGELVRQLNVDFLREGPVIALALEGIDVIVGPTEPKTAPPGTIRGDYAHIGIAYANEKKKAIRNIIHASGDSNDAKIELELWFSPKELHSYKTVHDAHIF
jgi:nucleoside-diphosphate kinase